MIDSDCRRVIKHPNVANISFKYPKVEFFLNSRNRVLYTVTWLAIRAHHAYTLGTRKSLPPLITGQQWHQFLMKILPFLHPESINVAVELGASTLLPAPQQDGKGKQKGKGAVKGKQALAHAKKSNTYLDEIPLRDTQIDRVVFYDTTIQLRMLAELEARGNHPSIQLS